MSLRIVVLGLSLSSSWGNGHATTWRGLLRALSARGHDIVFLERDRPWYAQNRDLPDPDFCRFFLYEDVAELVRWQNDIATADLTVVGSYVPDGIEVARLVRPWARQLAFYDIDTPVTLAQLATGDCAYLDASFIPDYDLYLSFTGGPTLRLLENYYGSPRARALYCAADPALYYPEATATKRWDLGYLGTYSADRQPALEALLLEPARRAPAKRFVVAGPQYPATIIWPENVERIEHLPPAEHRAFYAAQTWTLNITRADMIAAGYSPSVRLFEASACATPIISDVWDGIGDVLADGREIMLARTPDDVLSCLDMSNAAAVGAAARARFLSAHTAAHRATKLEQYIHELKTTASEFGQARQGKIGRDVPSPPNPPSFI